MSYLNIRKKLNKYIKLQPGGTLEYLKPQTTGLSITPDSSGLAIKNADGSVSVNEGLFNKELDEVADNIESVEGSQFGQKAGAAAAAIAGSLGKFAVDLGKQELVALGGQMGEMGVSSMEQGMKTLMQGNKDGLANLYAGGVTAAMGVAENELMGDKNFGAQSAAIDQTVHSASKALMSSGNPYAALAGVALEGANFLTKAGGQTVQGFDVNIDNSGYGNLGHMESSSSRDFGTLIGLGGLTDSKMEQKLARRNEQARMALKAAAISEDQSFEKEARTNSIDNVLRTNQMALAGGVDLSLI